MWIFEPPLPPLLLFLHPPPPLPGKGHAVPSLLHLLRVLSDLFKSGRQLSLIVFFSSSVWLKADFSRGFVGWIRTIFRKHISAFLQTFSTAPREPESMLVHVGVCVNVQVQAHAQHMVNNPPLQGGGIQALLFCPLAAL